jgi:hypothetical protein
MPLINIAVPATSIAAPAMVRVDEPVEGSAKRRSHQVVEFVKDAVLLLLIGALVPIAILVVGTPIALLVRVMIEIVKRL